MRYMIIVKATPATEAENGEPPDDALVAAMADYHEALSKAGVLLDGAGLQPSVKGWRIRYDTNGKRSITDGPFAEVKELVAGYTVIQAKSREEALEWTRRFPAPHGAGIAAEIEVRLMYELEDFGTGASVERLREMGLGGR